jgi:branched-chain amino acid aminotransferase
MQILEEGTMTGSYDDRDGKIWLDGQLVDWRAAQVHVMTHALHYASSVFEGERAYNGTIFRSRDHSERLHFSAGELDFEIPYSVDEVEAAKASVLAANGLSDAYVRAVAWRGAGEDMGVASARNPVRLAIAAWEWGAYYGDAKFKGAKLDIAKWKRPSPETIPVHAKAAGLYMICTTSKHAAEAKGCSDALFMDYRGYVAECTGANIFFVKDGRAGRIRAMLADRHGGRGHARRPDRRLSLRGRHTRPGHGRGLRGTRARLGRTARDTPGIIAGGAGGRGQAERPRSMRRNCVSRPTPCRRGTR